MPKYLQSVLLMQAACPTWGPMMARRAGIKQGQHVTLGEYEEWIAWIVAPWNAANPLAPIDTPDPFGGPIDKEIPRPSSPDELQAALLLKTPLDPPTTSSDRCQSRVSCSCISNARPAWRTSAQSCLAATLYTGNISRLPPSFSPRPSLSILLPTLRWSIYVLN